MHSIKLSGASAPPPIVLQAARVRRRISASDSVAELVASLAFGVGRDDHGLLAGVTAERIGAAGAVRS